MKRRKLLTFLGVLVVVGGIASAFYFTRPYESARCSNEASSTWSPTDDVANPVGLVVGNTHVDYAAALAQATAQGEATLTQRAHQPPKTNLFFFGAALSAHQAEGDNRNSDWWNFEQETKGMATSGAATDEYSRYDKDYALAAQLGHNATRFSIEWAKIEPEEGKIDLSVLAHYQAVFASLRRHGLEPIVTLWHFTVPEWFAKKGGFECKNNLHYYERYINLVGNEYAGQMKYVITINEPNVYAYKGYLLGEWPPGRHNDQSAYAEVSSNLAEAHREAYTILKKIDPTLQIGTANDEILYRAANGWNPIDQLIRAYLAYDWNHKFLDSVRDQTDFVGLNYYFCRDVKFDFALAKDYFASSCPSAQRTDLDWEIVPQGMYDMTMDLWQRYHKPILVTENGLADRNDAQRATFITEELAWLAKAKADGAQVIGYLHWALTDNFEWAEGFKPRFGLIEIDYKTLKRTVRPSAYVYRDLIRKYLKIFNK